MIPRSLQASLEGRQKAVIAFLRTGLTQEEFAKQLKISRSTLTNFLVGKSVYRSNFFKICQALNLNQEEILQPNNQLLDSIIQTRQQQFYHQFLATGKRAISLNRWLQEVFEEDWQTVEDIFGSTEANLAFKLRSADFLGEIRRAKPIALGVQLVALVVALTPEVDRRVGISMQLHPASGETYLPPNLKLVLLSQSGTNLQEVQSRSQDNYIQLKRFKLPQGKGFSVQVALDDVNVLENFIL
jgi:transcriptional regulator with XRE-family HTH domain